MDDPFAVLFTYRHPKDGGISLTLIGTDVLLQCHWPFDLSRDEWIDLTARFSQDEYLRAVHEAMSSGEATAIGHHGEKMSLRDKDSASFSAEFTNGRDGFMGKSLYLPIKQPLKQMLGPAREQG